MKALVIDDCYGDLVLTRMALTNSGFNEIDLAQSIEEVFEAIEHKAYDLVIIDKNFSNIDGYKLAKRIPGSIKVVVSGIEGPNVHFTKPLTPEKLELVINRGASYEEGRIGKIGDGASIRAESQQGGFSHNENQVRSVLDNGSGNSWNDRRVDYRPQSSVPSGRKDFHKSGGGRMMRVLKAMPYQAICTAGVLMAFACGSLVVSGVQMAKEDAYRSGQAEVIRFIPINVLTEIGV